MTSMVERMARALHATDAQRRDLVPAELMWEFGQKAYREYALAALRELREPSNEMIGAMRLHAVPKTQGLGAAFRAAIDAEIAAYEGKK